MRAFLCAAAVCRQGSVSIYASPLTPNPSQMLIVALGTVFRFPAAARRGLWFGRCGARPEDDQDFPDMLHGARIESRADFVEQRPACGTVRARRPDLDELVALQSVVDFPEYCRREARLADHDHRVKVVSPRAQRAPLGWGEFSHRKRGMGNGEW